MAEIVAYKRGDPTPEGDFYATHFDIYANQWMVYARIGGIYTTIPYEPGEEAFGSAAFYARYVAPMVAQVLSGGPDAASMGPVRSTLPRWGAPAPSDSSALVAQGG